MGLKPWSGDFASFRKVTGPRMTGRVWMPSSFASRSDRRVSSTKGRMSDRRQLRHEVVIVCFKPFGHFHRGYALPLNGMPVTGVSATRSIALRPARHREVDVERHLAACPAVTSWHGADHCCRVEHVVIE